MRPVLTAVLAIVTIAGTAQAEEPHGWGETTFSNAFHGSFRNVRTFSVPGKRSISNIIVGDTKVGETWATRILVLDCRKTSCTFKRIFTGPADSIKLAIVDLAGKPTAQRDWHRPARESYRGEIVELPTVRMRWPALVFETELRRKDTAQSRYGGTVTGFRSEETITFISLRKNERFPRVFQTRSGRGPTGAGQRTTVRLIKQPSSRVLIIEESRQQYPENTSLCILPKPTIHTFRYAENRFVEVLAKDLRRHGC